MDKFLIIQTAYTGDVVLATSIIEKLHDYYKNAQIDFLLRKGNEGLLKQNPLITNLLIWDKQINKKRNLMKMILRVKKEKYSHIINLHRFGTSGLITWLSGAKYKAGFDKNPFSFCYTKKAAHIISAPYAHNPEHEILRNHSLIRDLTDESPALPKLYPSKEDYELIKQFTGRPYICIAPASVWFTKQFPVEKWVELINVLPAHYYIYIIGAPGDKVAGDAILTATKRPNLQVLCGKLNFLQSAALMESAEMNYTNDSAPLHFASAMNAPVTAVFCSTVPAFGFGPIHNNGRVVEIKERLYCRPCGLHGFKDCPQGHFRCAMEITNDQLLWWISNKK